MTTRKPPTKSLSHHESWPSILGNHGFEVTYPRIWAWRRHLRRHCRDKRSSGRDLLRIRRAPRNWPGMWSQHHRHGRSWRRCCSGGDGRRSRHKGHRPGNTCRGRWRGQGRLDCRRGFRRRFGVNDDSSPGKERDSTRHFRQLRDSPSSFIGKDSHAAFAPQLGINALDAFVQAYMNVATLRQHFQSGDRTHCIINMGGDASKHHSLLTPSRRGVSAPPTSERLARTGPQGSRHVSKPRRMATGCRIEIRTNRLPLPRTSSTTRS